VPTSLALKIVAKKEAAKARTGKNSFPSTPFLFARLLGLRPQNFSAGRRDKKQKRI